jgi:hypothetical protein
MGTRGTVGVARLQGSPGAAMGKTGNFGGQDKKIEYGLCLGQKR